MAISNAFLVYILDQLSAWREVTTKRMFGGAGLFCDDKAFGLVADDVVYMKVDDTNRDKYIEAGSSPLKPFENKPTILSSYYELPPDILEEPEEFVEWAEESLAIQKKRK